MAGDAASTQNARSIDESCHDMLVILKARDQERPKPQDCKVSEWSDYSSCSRLCGSGTQVRRRKVDIPPRFGGSECPSLVESTPCNIQRCPLDCKVSSWSSWSPCSKPCGSGKQNRTRNILQTHFLDGKSCPTLSEEVSCNNQMCQ
jgi:hypothetical protein